MTTEVAISVIDLWERFRISEDRTQSLKELMSRFRASRGRKDVWALKGIDLQVTRGEALGLIGENGSGKSTLLRCIAGILPPTKGQVLVGGTISSLIELGAGFHPELTGRENVTVTGALFGLSRRRVRDSFDEIVDFSGLGNVIDQPVRSYSSGMYVRLAFSLAVHCDPAILLVDEVLAVGDESFQRKCVAKVTDMLRSGVTVVFVSHDLPLVSQVCPRSIFLQNGELMMDGDTQEVVDSYLSLVAADEANRSSDDR